MRLSGPDACHLVGRRAAPTTAAEVCFVINAACTVHAGAIFSARGCMPILNAIIFLCYVHPIMS